MTDDYRLHRICATWVSVYWPEDTRHSAAIETAMEELERLPGVKVHPRAVDIPHTVWRTQEFNAFLYVTGVDMVAAWQQYAPYHRLNINWADNYVKDIADFDADFHASAPCYPHQHEAAAHALRGGGLLLADEMGLGKTRAALLAAHYMHQEQRVYDDEPPNRSPTVIMGPLFTRSVWIAELLKMGIIESEHQVCVLAGRKNDADFFDEHAMWYFCHYDVAESWFPRFANRPPLTVIADEAHYLRNAATKRSQAAAVFLGSAQLPLVLTGTPIENRPRDLHALLAMVTGKGTWGSGGDFRVRYCGAKPGSYRGLEDGPPSEVDELRARMEPFYLRRTVEDSGQNLPGFTRNCIKVALEGKRAQLYSDTVKTSSTPTPEELLHALEHGAQGETLTLLHQLRTITSDAKRETTLALLDSMQEQSEPCVLFTWSRQQAEYFHRRLGTMDAFCVHGGFPIQARDQCVRDFQELGAEGRPAVMIATYGALREGVTLHAARHVIFHDLDWSPASIAQAEKRIHRIGQTRACVAHWMVAPQTIDTLFVRALVSKVEHADASIGVDYGFAGLAQSVGGSVVVDLAQEIEDMLTVWRTWKAS